MIALIDGDSLIWQIGYKRQEIVSDFDFDYDCQEKIKEIQLMANADSNHIFFSDKTKNIRKDIYKVKKYKGNRKVLPDWFKANADIIRNSLIKSSDKHSTSIGGYEADDLIYKESTLLNDDFIVCSIDKDLDQIEGKHCNYNNFTKGSDYLYNINYKEAFNMFAKLCLCGDSGDNIAGIPGFGEKSFDKFIYALKTRNQELDELSVLSVFIDYFQEYYGRIIYEETKNVVRLYKDSF